MSIYQRHVSARAELESISHASCSKLPLRDMALPVKHAEGLVLTEHLRTQIQLAIECEDLPIIIEGETGTGKEQVVQYIHRQISQSSDMPLVVLNCASLRGDLAASTMFGHKKGAFTGAHENSIGAIGKAHRGILFLDEFHRLPTPAQEQLLRTLQDGSYQRVGDTTQYYSKFRLVIATPRNIEEHAMAGEILMDLRFRLYGVDIFIPPLRERLDQLEDFIDFFMQQNAKDLVLYADQKKLLVRKCLNFHWQGNIRQLFGILQTVCLKARAGKREIRAEDLPVYPTMLAAPSADMNQQKASAALNHAASVEQPPKDEEKLIRLIKDYIEDPWAYEDFLMDFERELMRNLWDRSKSVKELCHRLRLPRSTLYSKRQRLGMDVLDGPSNVGR